MCPDVILFSIYTDGNSIAYILFFVNTYFGYVKKDSIHRLFYAFSTYHRSKNHRTPVDIKNQKNTSSFDGTRTPRYDRNNKATKRFSTRERKGQSSDEPSTLFLTGYFGVRRLV